MSDTSILEQQEEAYSNILTKLANEYDPEKIQQLANAAAQIEKGRNEANKIKLERELNDKKNEIDEKVRKETMVVEERKTKTDKRRYVIDTIIAIAGLTGGLILGLKTKSEENDSYCKQPKTDAQANRMIDRYTFKKK